MSKRRANLAVTILGVAILGGIAVYRSRNVQTKTSPFVTVTFICRVRNPDGTPAHGAQLSLDPWSGGAHAAGNFAVTADKDGEYRIPISTSSQTTSGGNKLSLPLAARSAHGIAFTSVQWGGGEASKEIPIDLRLKNPDTVTLHLIDAAGRPQAHARVDVVGVMDGQTRISIPKGFAPGFGGTSNDHGDVTLSGLPHGDQVLIGADDRFTPLNAPVSLDGGSSHMQNVVLTSGCVVEGTVRINPGGRPLAGVFMTGVSRSRAFTRLITSVTDADGRFRLTGLRPEQYQVYGEGYQAGWLTDTQTVSFTKPGETQRVEVHFTHTVRPLLRVHVQTKAGVPVANASIRDFGAAAAPSAASPPMPVLPTPFITDRWGDCYINITPGRHTVLLAQAPPGCTQGIPATRTVTCSPGQITTITFVVSGGPVNDLSGVVRSPDGKPVPGAVICIGPSSFHAPGHRLVQGEWGRFDTDAEWIAHGLVRMPEVTTTDSQGRFTVSHAWLEMPDSLWAAHGPTAASEPIPVRSGVGKGFTLVLRDRVLSALAGTVVDDRGAPVPNATVTADRHYGSGFVLPSPTLAVTDAHGEFQIDSLPAGIPYTLHISDTRHGRKDLDKAITLSPGESRRLPPISLPPTNSFVAGRVVDLHGRAVAEARVVVTGAVTGTREGMSDAQGRFRIAWVAREPLRIAATVVFNGTQSTPQTPSGLPQNPSPVIWGDSNQQDTGIAAYGRGGGLGSPPVLGPLSQTAAAGDANLTVKLGSN